MEELLLKFGFARALCGFDGKVYFYCKECRFYEQGHEHTWTEPKLVEHQQNCKVAAALTHSTGRWWQVTLSDQIRALPSVKGEAGADCVSREVVLGMLAGSGE